MLLNAIVMVSCIVRVQKKKLNLSGYVDMLYIRNLKSTIRCDRVM